MSTTRLNLTDLLTDHCIKKTVQKSRGNLQICADNLIDIANQKDGFDNISVILLDKNQAWYLMTSYVLLIASKTSGRTGEGSSMIYIFAGSYSSARTSTGYWAFMVLLLA
jgi:serine/threonine protein phosphatase PrpC